MRVATQCPHCHKTVIVGLQTAEEIPGLVGASQGSPVRVDQRRVAAIAVATPPVGHLGAPPRGPTAGSGGCVQATPSHRCPECGLATNLVYGTKKATGAGYQGQKCVNTACTQGTSDRFVPGTFRWVGQQAAAS